jgi:tetratricopeptide (TPR) repeat protein
LAWLGYVSTMRGRLEEGLRYADEAAKVEPVSAFSGFAWSARLDNRLAAGEVAVAQALLQERLDELCGLEPTPSMGGFMSLSIALEAAAVLGDEQACQVLYPRYVSHLGRCPIRPFDWALERRVAGMGAAALGQWDEAEEHFEQALAWSTQTPVLLDQPRVRHHHGRALLMRGRGQDAARARGLLTEALEDYRRIGMPLRANEVEQLLQG